MVVIFPSESVKLKVSVSLRTLKNMLCNCFYEVWNTFNRFVTTYGYTQSVSVRNTECRQPLFTRRLHREPLIGERVQLHRLWHVCEDILEPVRIGDAEGEANGTANNYTLSWVHSGLRFSFQRRASNNDIKKSKCSVYIHVISTVNRRIGRFPGVTCSPVCWSPTATPTFCQSAFSWRQLWYPNTSQFVKRFGSRSWRATRCRADFLPTGHVKKCDRQTMPPVRATSLSRGMGPDLRRCYVNLERTCADAFRVCSPGCSLW